MDFDTCIEKGGEWVKGLTPLTSHCVRKAADTLPAHPPSETDILAQREKDPPPKESERELNSIVNAARFKSHLLGLSDSIMTGLGPKNERVSWALSPGDVVWRSVAPGNDNVRAFGVYIGSGLVVYLGTAQRAVSVYEGRVYWRAIVRDDGERASLLSVAGFTVTPDVRCGVYNPNNDVPRIATILIAAACVGVVLKRLAREDAQHIAAYARTGVWLVESPEALERRIISPTHFKGEFSKSRMGAAGPALGFETSSVSVAIGDDGEPGEIPAASKDAFTTFRGATFVVTYPTAALAEEFYRQKSAVQPYHDPLTGTYIAEDQVATVLLAAMVSHDEARLEESL